MIQYDLIHVVRANIHREPASPCTARAMHASFTITLGKDPPGRSSRGMAMSSSPTANATLLHLILPPPLSPPPPPPRPFLAVEDEDGDEDEEVDGAERPPRAFARATLGFGAIV